jgi:hypothetical protein
VRYAQTAKEITQVLGMTRKYNVLERKKNIKVIAKLLIILFAKVFF